MVVQILLDLMHLQLHMQVKLKRRALLQEAQQQTMLNTLSGKMEILIMKIEFVNLLLLMEIKLQQLLQTKIIF